MTLREQVARAIYESDRGPNDEPWVESDCTEQLEYLANADAVLVVFAERERLLRERIEALRGHDSLGGELESIEDDAPPGSGWLLERADVLGVFDDES